MNCVKLFFFAVAVVDTLTIYEHSAHETKLNQIKTNTFHIKLIVKVYDCIKVSIVCFTDYNRKIETKVVIPFRSL